MPLKIFGKAQRAPSAQESIIKLQETLEMLAKREEYLQKKVGSELSLAKKYAVVDRRKAMMALKRKNTYEGQIEKLSGAQLTIEQQLMTIEGAHVSLEAMNAMRMGARTMQTIHNHMTVDQVDDTMDDIREQMEVAAEINEAISQPLGGELYDELELEEQLAELEEEAKQENRIGATKREASQQSSNTQIENLPPVPDSKLLEEQEFQNLQAEMMGMNF
mmetsp:Transcript_61/g.81  ORF Transcript_61/g.81 Transcript_61/m.81 type:complete len:219 (+) Transcript_61:15-671(+)|eukprot:CAMPEP_0117035650 /NCGR_PEP_ID=MMETSP0472-20121206/25305_1 /TAXON_ID=693140 ORGANISM="Tiarina fusus, Strain LIS" /NCGR_SAMPLE_ID=MMETSP0472 /ASSEMBLY_ACC=CAM_ASM_000603 /LENGTH=218 /DNA_ID=CAMNT_0004745181 /DNA_START=15 /DNA_END=671 /DNA_ORIENTATION=+